MAENNCAMGCINLPIDSERVTDADEEVFLLYTALQSQDVQSISADSFRGLGHLDNSRDILILELNLGSIPDDSSDLSPRKSTTRKKRPTTSEKIITVELAQDKTALRSRKGDTGSIVWRASVDFATAFLRQHHNQIPNPLIHSKTLEGLAVLELGAGTGLLSVLLSSLCRRYTCTDLPELVPLIRKNISLNGSRLNEDPSKPSVTALDWIEVHNATPHLRFKILSSILPKSSDGKLESVDLLIATDVTYQPALLPALLSTMSLFTTPGKTTAVIVTELRSSDVILEFLTAWMEDSSWEIWRVGQSFLGLPYAVWVACKPCTNENTY